MTVYGKLPVFLRQFDTINLYEVMHYLYLPVQMHNSTVRLPKNLEQLRPLVEFSRVWCHRYQRGYDYTYVTARKGWASPDNPLNRPGWHCDGFGTDDLNFIWWAGPGTRFAWQPFENISTDHVRSMEQFEEQVQEKNIVSYPERGLYSLDDSVVHSTPLIDPPGCWRQFIKISMSDHPYNLENNSHNYLFDYDWPLHARADVRNDTSRAQKDYV